MSTRGLGSLVSRQRWSVRICCLGLLLAFGARTATAQVRTVLVSPTAGNPTASGTTLLNALSGISSPSSTNRWLLKIEPGIYDVGSTSLAMRSWVDIEGSGVGVTTIRGSVPIGSSYVGTVNGASDAELRMVTVEAVGSGSVASVIAMENDNVFPRVYRVKFVASGGAVGWGMRNYQSAPQIEECEFSVSASGTGSVTYGIVFRDYVSGGQRSSILRSKIAVSGAASNYGIYLVDGQTVTELRNSRIDATASGSAVAYGIFATKDGSWTGSDNLTLRDAEVFGQGGGSAYGVYLDSNSTVNMDISASKVWGHIASTNNYGIYQAGSAIVVLQSSNIVGATHTVQSVSNNVSIASTLLYGGSATAGGWIGCMGVWDESAVFYTNTCP